VQRTAFRNNYPPEAVSYCEDSWLVLFKEKLVAYWVNSKLNFGITVTSPIEGCHAGLKAFLRKSTQDLMGVFEKLLLFWDAQNSRIVNTIAGKQYKLVHSTNKAPFIPLRGLVHEYALRLLLQEQRKIPKKKQLPEPPCSCTIQTSYGLPCFHTIYERTQDPGYLLAEDVHAHWWITRPEPGSSARITMPLPD
jgi:hypothetical protein